MNRWKYACTQDKCYMKECVLDLTVFDRCFPSSMGMGDIDGIFERNGKFIVMEFKPSINALTQGQDRTLRALSRLPEFTVYLVIGQASTMSVSGVCRYRGGERGKLCAFSTAELKKVFSDWYIFVDSLPKAV